MKLSDVVTDEEQLEDVLTTPSPALVQSVRGFSGTFVILGIAGKVGPTLAGRLRRALELAGCHERIIGVSRFTDPAAASQLQQMGIDTIAADLLNPDQVDALPDADRIIYLAGRKFGTTGQEDETWATNALPPAQVCRRYPGKPIVAFSTGAVYDVTQVDSGGASEDHPLEPRGEYANAAVARERIFQWASNRYGTPVCLIRLFYANDLRYGVVRDLAERIRDGKPIDLAMGYVNLIWQGDAVDQTLRAFACTSVPPAILNVTGAETVSVRELAERLGNELGKTPVFERESRPDALLGNTKKAISMFGRPEVSLEQMIRWTAAWVIAGGRGLGKPTHYGVRDGRF